MWPLEKNSSLSINDVNKLTCFAVFALITYDTFTIVIIDFVLARGTILARVIFTVIYICKANINLLYIYNIGINTQQILYVQLA